MDTCTMKIEVTAFRNDNDNGLESISASIGVPIESNREVIRKMVDNQELTVHAVEALYNLVGRIRPDWLDDKDTRLKIETYVNGYKWLSCSGHVTMKPEGFIFDPLRAN
jgi:hypothetical protein